MPSPSHLRRPFYACLFAEAMMTHTADSPLSQLSPTLWRWLVSHRYGVVMVALTLLAAALRFWALDRLPPGLYRDEAYEGLDALGVLNGKTPLFFTANNGREPLFVYLVSPFIALFGRSPWALRLLPAIAGVLLVPAAYVMGRELLGRFEGLLTAALVTCSVWALNLSRLALRASLLPLLVALAVAFLVRGLRQQKWQGMLISGFLWGLGLYCYLPARFSLVVICLFGLYLLLHQRRSFWWSGWLLLTAGLVVVAAPLAIYYMGHPADFLGRTGQVSIMNPAINQGDLVGALLRSIWYTILGFFYRGDFIPRHNIPLRPFLEPLMGVAFIGGLFLIAKRVQTHATAVLVLLWLPILCLPTVLAEGAPHMLRAIGLLLVLYLPVALGLAWFRTKLCLIRAPWLGSFMVAVVLVQAGANSVLAYQKHLHSEAVYYNFESGATQLASEINRYRGSGWQSATPGIAVQGETPRQVLLAERLWENWPSVRFLCQPGTDLIILPPPGQSIASQPTSANLVLMLWPFEDNSAALALLPRDRLIIVSEGASERGDLEANVRLLYIAVESRDPGALPKDETVRWQQGVTLIHHTLKVMSSTMLLVTLYWQVDQEPGTAYTVYVHLVSGGSVIGQHDGPPAFGYYGTERWRAGDIIQDQHYLVLQQPYDAERDRITVGIYLWPDMTHLELLDSGGTPTGITELILEQAGTAP
ncbi:MAG: glycosyltransferase family 39 protein [Anaerolineae bacterium]